MNDFPHLLESVFTIVETPHTKCAGLSLTHAAYLCAFCGENYAGQEDSHAQDSRSTTSSLRGEPFSYTQIHRALKLSKGVISKYVSLSQALVGHRLDVRIGMTMIEAFYKGKRVSVHPRAFRGGFTTLSEHMPKSHQKHHQWSPGRFLNWAKEIGPATLTVVKHQLNNRPHPEHGYRACLGLLNQGKRYTAPRLEAACERALKISSPTYRSIASILEKGLDQQREESPTQDVLPLHGNVRGANYYH